MPELTEPQRATRRKQARNAIETAIANSPASANPAELADRAFEALGDLAAEILVDGTMMRSLTIKDGVATLELSEATEILKIFVASMRGILDGYGAENYVETEMTAPSVSMDLRHGPDPRDSYTVTIQRRTSPTPHQFRERAEQQRNDVLRIVTEYVVESNDIGGIDCNDLANRLRAAGHPLPGDED
ncbi:hypothetical protein [Streptomyces sp. WAC08241]|uniref:hypothetical protein n=1 Tax=Streptomyces sp. WAC08241 TaxID=2487421 RepID=UPI000F7B5330|nr:hypothetical protein [Streptomyces sp. WAC08241]RSS32566.1 hypothetical protein EF906_33665 [Streptomyces sp. WAC08241]